MQANAHSAAACPTAGPDAADPLAEVLAVEENLLSILETVINPQYSANHFKCPRRPV